MSRVDLPLVRRRDGKRLGTLTIIRTDQPSLVDEESNQRRTPGQRDRLIIRVADTAGEEVTTVEVPMQRLPPDGPETAPRNREQQYVDRNSPLYHRSYRSAVRAAQRLGVEINGRRDGSGWIVTATWIDGRADSVERRGATSGDAAWHALAALAEQPN